MQIRTIGTGPLIQPVSVSYTHLDVYKRQEPQVAEEPVITKKSETIEEPEKTEESASQEENE